MTERVRCKHCAGTGEDPDYVRLDGIEECVRCNGTGFRPASDSAPRDVPRPPWCQDHSCTPDSNSLDERTGGSAFCCGRVPEPLVVERHGIRHENDGHFCVRTAVRGVVMLEVKATDLELFVRLALRSLVAREPEREFNWYWFTGRPRELAANAAAKDAETAEAVQ